MHKAYNEIEEFIKLESLQKNINDLLENYKDKKVIGYGAGAISEIILDNFNLSEINIVAFADKKYENSEEKTFKGYKTISPQQIKDYNPDLILIFNLKSDAIIEFFKENYPELNTSEILPIISSAEIPDSIKEAFEKRINYAKQSILINGKYPTNFSINLGVAPCNHSCLFCPQSVKKPKKAKWMEMDLLKKVLEEMPQEAINVINVSAYCETLASPNLIPAIRMIKSTHPDIPVVMSSNGSLFKEEIVEELIDIGLDYYSYSFDGATRQDYKNLMQVDDFDKIWENLEKLVAIKQKKNSQMKILTHIMHFQGVEKDFENFKSHWENKLDSIVLRRVANWGSEEMGLMKNLKKLGFVPAHQVPESRYPCPSIFYHFKISYDGYYYPCVAAIPEYEHSIEPIGHVDNITWMQAWEKLSEMRQAHLEGKWNNYDCCKTCDVWGIMFDPMWFRNPQNSEKFYIPGVEYVK
jgi:MoaA/NifB/PqqE/SkfB family radical SAM enzyme